MFNLGGIIISLLHKNDCVVIPGFGGFVAQYSSANLDETTGIFSPPYKQVLFNKNLINNDGLLANAISQNQNLDFDAANKFIENEINLLNDQLKTKKQASIKGLGLIYLHNGIIKFKQNSDNILSDSYGLLSINIKEFQQEINSNTTKVLPLNVSNTPNFKKWWVAAAIFPLMFYSAWLPLKTNLFSDSATFHYSDLNPFTFTKQKKYSPESLFNTKTTSLINRKETVLNPRKTEIKPTLQLGNIKNNKPKKISPKNEIKYTEPLVKFHLIVGCFSSVKNSKKLIRELNKKGNNAIEFDFHKNLHRVSIASFSSKSEAVEHKNKIKNTQSISSWILKK
jgi:nucleoid DNA-binding protein